MTGRHGQAAIFAPIQNRQVVLNPLQGYRENCSYQHRFHHRFARLTKAVFLQEPDSHWSAADLLFLIDWPSFCSHQIFTGGVLIKSFFTNVHASVSVYACFEFDKEIVLLILASAFVSARFLFFCCCFRFGKAVSSKQGNEATSFNSGSRKKTYYDISSRFIPTTTTCTTRTRPPLGRKSNASPVGSAIGPKQKSNYPTWPT